MAVEVAAGKCGVVHYVKKTQQIFSTHHVFKLPFVWMSASWFLDVDILDLDFVVVQVDSVKITSPEQLGGCGIHVSSSGFGL